MFEIDTNQALFRQKTGLNSGVPLKDTNEKWSPVPHETHF